MKRILLSFLFTLAVVLANSQDIGGDYYVAPIGHSYEGMGEASDNNDGSYESPFATWQKAIEVAVPGDLIYIRGGIWKPKSSFHGAATVLIDPDAHYIQGGIGNHGTPENRIYFYNYPNERPVLDCRDVLPVRTYIRGFIIERAEYWSFRGFDVINVLQDQLGDDACGIRTERTIGISFEDINIHDIGGMGMWIECIAGHKQYPDLITDTVKVINCDFYNCADTLANNPWNMGDGVKGDIEPGGVFIMDGCRAWNNSDDGFDISGPGQKIVTNSWAFNMGINYQHISDVDDGNGFKLGGTRDSVDHNNWIMKNCISAGNYAFAIQGLDYAPYYRNNARCYNSAFYNNENGPWSFTNAGKLFGNDEYYNCISYNNSNYDNYYLYENTVVTSNWVWASNSPPYKPNPTITVTNDDFVSLDIQLLKAQRKADNSLPDVDFMKLVKGSDLIDAGTDIGVGIAYNEKAPDVGAFEFITGGPTVTYTVSTTEADTEEMIAFDASKSYDNGSIVSYDWNFGDDQIGAGVTTTHRYTKFGTYIATLTVTDNDNNTASISRTIQIRKPAPTRPHDGAYVYPNPVDDIFNLIYSGEAKQLDIYAMDGVLVLQQQTPSYNQTIKVSHLPSGVYIVIVSLESGQESTKFVKK